MASKGTVTLRGRFSPGTSVELVQVSDGSVLRSEGGKVIDTKTVDKDGTVRFTGAEVDGYYFIRGVNDGFPLDVRARGKADADSDVGFQAPVQYERVKLSDGSFLDEPPADEKPGGGHVGPAPSQQQARGEQLRSATPRGYAHPVEKREQAPYPSQDQVRKGTPQRSDTERGMATPVVHEAPNSQADVRKGTAQRSATPLGYATPVPEGDAVEAQRDREAAVTKAAVGDPQAAAANPPSVTLKATDRDRDNTVVLSADSPRPPVPEDERADTSGLDAQGQPADEGVAASAGVEVADKPAEPVRRSRKGK